MKRYYIPTTQFIQMETGNLLTSTSPAMSTTPGGDGAQNPGNPMNPLKTIGRKLLR